MSIYIQVRSPETSQLNLALPLSLTQTLSQNGLVQGCNLLKIPPGQRILDVNGSRWILIATLIDDGAARLIVSHLNQDRVPFLSFEHAFVKGKWVEGALLQNREITLLEPMDPNHALDALTEELNEMLEEAILPISQQDDSNTHSSKG